MKRALARLVAIGAGAAAIGVGLVGFAHTSAGRPLLGAVTRMAHGGCPFGYDKPMSPEQRERASFDFAASHRGAERAASRPALGFVLDHTTRSEVIALMAQHGVRCEAAKGLSDLACNGVPSDALQGATPAPPRNLWFTFGSKQQVLSVVAISRDTQAEAVSTAFMSTRGALDREVGKAARTHGDPEARALSEGALHQASAEFRFSDYYALTRVTNLGKGFALTEEYRSLPL